MRTGQSFFFPSHGVNNASIKAGLDWLLSQPCKEKMLVFCGIKNAKNIACYPEAKSFFDLLINKREIIIPDSLKSHIILRIPQTLPSNFSGAVLAIHLPDADLELIDSIDGHFDVLFVPWIITEGERWRARWGATDIQSGEKVFLSKIVLTPELNSILSSTCAPNLNHSNDYNRIIEALKKLHSSGRMPEPAIIAEFLKQNNWDFSSADKVAELATKIATGRVVKKR